MPEHSISSDVGATGGEVSARCACGALLRAENLTDLGVLIDEHLIGAGLGQKCRSCGGSLVPWTSSRGTVNPSDGRCGPCLRDLLGERAYAERTRP